MNIDMGYGTSIGNTVYIDMVIYHVDLVILDIDVGYGLMIWEMTVSIRSSPISIWDICHSAQRCPSTDNECPSHSDIDILRSSLFRMGKMGGVPVTGPPRTDHFRSGRTFGRVTTPGSDPLLTSHNSRTHFTKRQGDFFSSKGHVPNSEKTRSGRAPTKAMACVRVAHRAACALTYVGRHLRTYIARRLALHILRIYAPRDISGLAHSCYRVTVKRYGEGIEVQTWGGRGGGVRGGGQRE